MYTNFKIHLKNTKGCQVSRNNQAQYSCKINKKKAQQIKALTTAQNRIH